MRFLDPCIFYGAHRTGNQAVADHARAFGERLLALAHEARAAATPAQPAVGTDERRITTENL